MDDSRLYLYPLQRHRCDALHNCVLNDGHQRDLIAQLAPMGPG